MSRARHPALQSIRPFGLLLGLWGALPVAGSAAEAVDHALVSPYQGSVLRDRQDQAFDAYRRIVGNGPDGPVVAETEGKVSRLRYSNPKGRSTLEIERNYRDALTSGGMVVEFACAGRQACGHQRRPGWNTLNGINMGAAGDVRYFTGRLSMGGGDAYVSVAINPTVTYLHIVEPAQMQSGQVRVDLEALARALETDGRVELPGILFDTGTSKLQATSDRSLDVAADLLRQRPTLRLDVVGHTDSQGDEVFNRDLSQRRAAAVVQALVGRGIDGRRLAPHGKGSEEPAADNATEAGRARNRRVELVRSPVQ